VNPALMARVKPMVDQFTATLNSGNTDSHAALYTTDAIIIPDNDYHYYGHVGAKKLATKNKAGNLLTGPIQIMDIKDGHDYLIMQGKFTDSLGPGDVLQYWKDVNGQLQLNFMLYNWDAPSTANHLDQLGNAAVKQRVQARLNELAQKFDANDMDGVAAMYMQFGKIFPPNDFVHLGPEGVRKVNQDIHDSGITKITREVVEADQAGDTVTAWGYYKKFKGAEFVEEGTFLFVMKDVAGQLMIQYRIWNPEWIESERTATDKLAQGFYDDFLNLYNAGKIPEAMTMYVPDAVRIEDGVPTLAGLPAIQQDVQTQYAQGVRYHIEVIHAYPAGDYIISTGRQRTLKNDVVQFSSKFMDILRVVGGKPKYFYDTFASN